MGGERGTEAKGVRSEEMVGRIDGDHVSQRRDRSIDHLNRKTGVCWKGRMKDEGWFGLPKYT